MLRGYRDSASCRQRVQLSFRFSWLVHLTSSSFPFPARSFFSIFQDDSGVEQLLPDLIGPREVARLLGGGPFLDQFLHTRIGQPARSLRGFENGEDSIEAIEKIQRRRGVAGA